MLFLPSVLRRQVSGAVFDAKMGQLVCYLAALALPPMAIVAMVRHSGSRSEFFIGLGLALVIALLFVMLGGISRHIDLMGVPLRARCVEILCYFAGVGVLVGGIRSLATIGGSPAQITLGVLVSVSLSLTVLVLGMLATVTRTLRTRTDEGDRVSGGAPAVF
ncbi:hypothetical protein V5E97_28160 [Singulisphaera sp. Ch08]|uniref:Uncharacterized protein n=1 Tax=Singulisphaera sp. Ch08 TaxID=3120278 RepID=A0AAU7CAB7_9BACT